MRVTVIDYKAGNLTSVLKALRHLGAEPEVTDGDLALGEAAPGDVVLLAGKGHEKEQILAGGAIPFDDARIALSALGAMGFQPEVGGVE